MKALLLASLALFACGDAPARPVAAVVITTGMPGASSEVIERQVVMPLEAMINAVEGITGLEARIERGIATLRLDVSPGRDPMATSQAVRAALTEARRELPQGAELPMVQIVRFDDRPAIQLAIESDQPRADASRMIEHELVRRLETLVGVGRIERHGLVRSAVIVHPDFARLAAYGASLSEVADAVRTANVTMPGGRIGDPTGVQLRITGRHHDVASLTDLVVKQSDEQAVRLRDVATVEVGVERESEEPTLRLDVHAQASALRIDVRETVRARLRELPLPVGMKVTELTQPAGPPPTVLVGSIVGPDHAELERFADAILAEATTAGVVGVVRDPAAGTPEMVVEVEHERAARYGIPSADVAGAIRTALGGDVLGEMVAGDDAFPILVRPPAVPLPQLVQHIYVRGVQGPVPLSDVVSVTAQQASSVLRRNRERAIDLRAPVAAAAKVRAQLEQHAGKWPPGYRAVLAR